MAVGNRTETKSAVTAALVPTLTLAQLITLWNDSVNESNLFRKDIIDSETEAGGNVTINYSNKDTVTVTTAVNLAVSFTDIENGDVKYLEITKVATNTISFAGATDVSIRKTYINTIATLVVYQVFNKNGNIYVSSINIVNDNESWQTPSYVNNHSDYTTGDFSALRYRRLANGMLQLAGSFQRSVVSTGIVFTLAAGFRPAQSLPIFGRREDESLVGGFISSAGVVTIFLDSSVADDHMDLNIIMPLDLTV